MRVLLTGASGFLGGHVAADLVEHGHTVVALLRKASSTEHLPLTVERAEGSLTDAPSLARAAAGVDAVVHAAGLIKARKQAEFFEVNVEGTRRAVEAAVAGGAKTFVVVSSLAARGPSNGPHPRDPAVADGPVTAYGKSKLEGEKVALQFANRLRVVVIRPPAIYGPWDRETFAVFQLARFAVGFRFAGGTKWVSMIHARDAASAIRTLLVSQSPSGRIYPIDDGGVYTVSEVAEAAARAIGRKRSLQIPVPLAGLEVVSRIVELWGRISGQVVLLNRDKAKEFAQRAWVGGHDAITRDTGWQPRIPLAEGLEETGRWYREAGWL